MITDYRKQAEDLILSLGITGEIRIAGEIERLAEAFQQIAQEARREENEGSATKESALPVQSPIDFRNKIGGSQKMKILKYPLTHLNTWFDLPIPATSKIIAFQAQNTNAKRNLMIWAIPGDATMGHKKVIAVGTGIDFDDVGMNGSEKYIATAQDDGFVWHLFEEEERND